MGVALVAIGRNEGDRLRACLDSVVSKVRHVIYVDSGSTDGSVALARSKGVEVVELDMSIPFTAARARNSGFSRLRAVAPETSLVQFVDGDCEVNAHWITRSAAYMHDHSNVAAVFGRRSERHPTRSVYNWLCDFDWNAPPGDSKYCGGDVMMRASALQSVGGYRDDLIAGEEADLSIRLRARGWLIHSLDADMTLHDADMTRWGQWWRRTVRTGFAYAQGFDLHGRTPERHWHREVASLLAWGVVGPAIVLVGSVVVSPWLLLALIAYPLQVARLAVKAEGSPRQRLLRGAFLVLGKFPQAQGALRYYWQRMWRQRSVLIEYK